MKADLENVRLSRLHEGSTEFDLGLNWLSERPNLGSNDFPNLLCAPFEKAMPIFGDGAAIPNFGGPPCHNDQNYATSCFRYG